MSAPGAEPRDEAAGGEPRPGESAAARGEAAGGEPRPDERAAARGEAAGGEPRPDERAAARGEAAGGEPRPGERAAARGEARPDQSGARGGETAPDAMTRGYARSRARTEALQAQLQPLGPDERPLGLKLAVALALLIAVANVVGVAAGVGGGSPALGVLFAIFMGALAAAMWARRYLALLLFQALLAITLIVSTLSLAFARTATQAVVAVMLIVLSAPVFWLLIRVMARLQVPRG